MEKQAIIIEIDELIVEGKTKVLSTEWDYSGTGIIGFGTYVDQDVYYSWRMKTMSFLKLFLDETHEYVKVFENLTENNYSYASTCVQTLENVKNYIQKGYINLEQKKEIDVDGTLDRIFARFHKVARQLRSRHAGRNTLEIEDEYDVQDLLHAILQLYFDDIRDEEWTPSYAGSAARVDFLLKNEKTVIEVKKTRQGPADKEVGNQLIEDIERYQAHPDCEKLVCFVYDPEGRIGNPNGVMNDLNSRHERFAKVVIEPNI